MRNNILSFPATYKSKPNASTEAIKHFLGKWRIEEMEKISGVLLDHKVNAYIRFRKDGQGRFAFARMKGILSWNTGKRNGQEVLEFSWEYPNRLARDGIGWAGISGECLQGEIIISHGDTLPFRATKKNIPSRKVVGPRNVDLDELCYSMLLK